MNGLGRLGKWAFGVSLVAALGVAATPEAEARRKLKLPTELSDRLKERAENLERRDGKQATTLEEVVEDVDGDETITLPNGKTITAQEYTDIVGDAHRQHNLRQLRDEGVDPDTAKKIKEQEDDHGPSVLALKKKQRKSSSKAEQRSAVRAKRKAERTTKKQSAKEKKEKEKAKQSREKQRLAKQKKRDGKGGGSSDKNFKMSDKGHTTALDDIDDTPTPSGCTAETCDPSTEKTMVSWSKELGDSKILAAYTGFDITSRHPDAYTSGCDMAWDNGLYFFKKKHSILKFSVGGEANTSTHGIKGSAALYLMGKSTWSKSGSFQKSDLSRTIRTPKVEFTYSFFGVINLTGAIDGGVTIGLLPTSAQESDDDGVECKIEVKPGLSTDVKGTLSVSIGIKKFMELIQAGIGVDVVPFEISLPTKLGVEVNDNPLSADLFFKNELDVEFLKGRFFVYYKLGDICLGKKDPKTGKKKGCLLEDVFKIKTYGEKTFYQSKAALAYKQELANVDQALTFRKEK